MGAATAQDTRTERDRKQIYAHIPTRLHGKLTAERQSLDATPSAANHRWRRVNHTGQSPFGRQPVPQTQGRLPDHPPRAPGMHARCCFSKSHLKTFPPWIKPLAGILRNIGTTCHPPVGGLSISPEGFALAAWCERQVHDCIRQHGRIVAHFDESICAAESVIGIDASWHPPPKPWSRPPSGG